ncbi:MAG: hypothetical protein A2Z11_04415 [Candidatus Woykebacteria bacterium RBG_16_43_9]|uniref:Uncharacterized protein n=1 Tax=Candidatus Woykebacteria bacterium RBG_16_43_9 TaxID=1802596 RepID=A0A1G1WDG2_9BACT|nr:MAG: hypothetical protein A2Z11_04415 [Candidatus Woykebacteria bacterium RBG_16_43_9]
MFRDKAEDEEEISEPTVLTNISGRWVRSPIGKPGHRETCSDPTDTFTHFKTTGHSARLEAEAVGLKEFWVGLTRKKVGGVC